MFLKNDGCICYVTENKEVLATLTYVVKDHQMWINHTFVSPELRGKGIAQKLVEEAICVAQEKQYKIKPVCSYVAAFFERMPQYPTLLVQ